MVTTPADEKAETLRQPYVFSSLADSGSQQARSHFLYENPRLGGEPFCQAEQDRRIDYVEFLTTNMNETKTFYSGVFGWEFTDHGPDYTSFNDDTESGTRLTPPRS